MKELELNVEYTYKNICNILGWDEKEGNSKIVQIRALEDAYEFYHPENKKTHKLKKVIFLLKKLKI